MRLSKNFIKDYIDINNDIKSIAEDMMHVGNEYDSCGKLVASTNLIIGEITSCVAHPDSDHLHVCEVNIGNEVLQIVCGAPNARAGIKVIVAKVGATLPGNIIIKDSKIRGVESHGMLCSLQELGLDNKFLTEQDKTGIHEFDDNAKVGDDPIIYLGLDDEVIDFELTANRGDLLSILGMAYELGAIYNKQVKDIDLKHSEDDTDINDSFHLDINTDNCHLFLAKKVKNVTIKESPTFIKSRLISSGIRPINNVVDISNYVMLETGQPIHFYDADALNNMLEVRMAKDNETLVTLDNEKRVLDQNDIVISDGTKAIGLAGVMGGLDTEITDNTKNIVIEVAIFDPIKIRLTSKKVLKSEASTRFEKGLDPVRSYMAIDRCCNLLEKYADAIILKGTTAYDKTSHEDKKIKVSIEKINKVLGLSISKEEIIDVFNRLGFKVNNSLEVSVPTRRLDVNIEEDLIEEVGRIYGVDNIIGRLPIISIKSGKFNKENRLIKNKLISLGLSETLTYTLINNHDINKYTIDSFNKIRILDPMTEDRAVLRYSLLSSLMNVYNYNKARNMKDICIFELGKGFYKQDNTYVEEEKLSILMTGTYYNQVSNNKAVDFYTIKGIIENLLNYLGYSSRYVIETAKEMPKEFHPGQTANILVDYESVGIIGKIHPSVSKDDIYLAEISLNKLNSHKVSKVKYREISKYPTIEKDAAFVIDKTTSSKEIIDTIKKSGGKLLQNISVFDVYEGDKLDSTKRSIAYNLKFSTFDRTLTDDEVDTLFRKIISDVTSKHNAILRDN